MTKILYLHGFASSADSTKAELTKSFIEKKTKKTKILIPDLDNDIEVAFYQIENIISEESITAFIGSSLGGFYGTYFSEKYNLRCVNINPAVPPLNMSQYLGENTNYSTGEKFIINKKHLNFIDKMCKEIQNVTKPKNFMTLIQSKDEVLDYKRAVKYFAGSRIELIFGGSHSFENFDLSLIKIANFLNLH